MYLQGYIRLPRVSLFGDLCSTMHLLATRFDKNSSLMVFALCWVFHAFRLWLHRIQYCHRLLMIGCYDSGENFPISYLNLACDLLHKTVIIILQVTALCDSGCVLLWCYLLLRGVSKNPLVSRSLYMANRNRVDTYGIWSMVIDERACDLSVMAPTARHPETEHGTVGSQSLGCGDNSTKAFLEWRTLNPLHRRRRPFTTLLHRLVRVPMEEVLSSESIYSGFQ